MNAGSNFASAFAPSVMVGSGSFQTNGTSAVTVRDMQRGLPFTVAYSGTGVYTVTFDARYKFPARPSFVGASIAAPLSAAVEAKLVSANLSGAGAATIVIQITDLAGAAVAPPAAGVGAHVSFLFVASNSVGK